MHATRRDIERSIEALHPAAFGWAVMCCRGDEAEAEDVVQDAYLRLLSGRARFEGRSEYRTFVFGVVRRVAAERARKRERRWRLLRVARAEMDHTTSGPDSVAADEASRLRRALNQLSERQAQVLHLVFYSDLTIESAAEVIGVSVGTARTHYERGKTRLREILEGEPPESTRGALA